MTERYRRWRPWHRLHRHDWGPVYFHLNRYQRQCRRCTKLQRMSPA